MTLAAKVSATELDRIVRGRYVGNFFEARLLNNPGITYVPGGGVSDETWLATEVPLGTAGYERQVIGYGNSDVSNYADGGIGLSQKGTVFAHDGSGTVLSFTHVALVWSSGNADTLSAPTSAPASASTTSTPYTNIPIDSTDGNGRGMTVDLTVINGGVAPSDYSVSVNRAGYGYEAGDELTVLNGTIAGLDAGVVGAGDLVFSVGTVYSPTIALPGEVLSIAKPPSAVDLTAGNEAIFYWNLKQFGFFSS